MCVSLLLISLVSLVSLYLVSIYRVICAWDGVVRCGFVWLKGRRGERKRDWLVFRMKNE